MARGAKPAQTKAEVKSPVGRKVRNREGSRTGELQKRLAEALEQHAAISEILNVMSASPSDVQPVLAAVAERAAHLCGAPLARVLLVDGDVCRAMAEYSLDGTSQAWRKDLGEQSDRSGLDLHLHVAPENRPTPLDWLIP